MLVYGVLVPRTTYVTGTAFRKETHPISVISPKRIVRHCCAYVSSARILPRRALLYVLRTRPLIPPHLVRAHVALERRNARYDNRVINVLLPYLTYIRSAKMK
jgi:hypothetical protein